MPCYCDEPDEKDQAEIERRCKVRMYFDVQELMTDEQIKKSHKLKISAFPLPDPNTALCKLCSILTSSQLKKISAQQAYPVKWEHKTLYDWYVKHCKDDLYHNDKQY